MWCGCSHARQCLPEEKVVSQEVGREDRSSEVWVRSPELPDTTAVLLVLISSKHSVNMSLLLNPGQWRRCVKVAFRL